MYFVSDKPMTFIFWHTSFKWEKGQLKANEKLANWSHRKSKNFMLAPEYRLISIQIV